MAQGVMLCWVMSGCSKSGSTEGARCSQSLAKNTLSAVVLIPTRIFATSPKDRQVAALIVASHSSAVGSESRHGVFVSSGMWRVPTRTS